MNAYIFPGQGSQYVGMAKGFFDAFPEARTVFKKANEILGFNIIKLCFEGPKEELIKTENSQPAILTASIACLEALRSPLLTVNPKLTRPDFMAGLSLGEYSALVAAGSLTFEQALKLVRKRARFMEEASKENPGRMLAVIGLSLEAVRQLCQNSGAELANLNSPHQTVISGSNQKIEEALKLAKKMGAKRLVILEVSGPFHSSLMSSASQRLEDELERIEIKAPKVPVVSNVTAAIQSSPEQIRANLAAQLNSPVRWEESIRFIASRGVNTFQEIGPGRVLKGILHRIDSSLEVYNIEKVEDIVELRRSLCY